MADASHQSELELHFLRVAKAVQVPLHGFVHAGWTASEGQSALSGGWQMRLDGICSDESCASRPPWAGLIDHVVQMEIFWVLLCQGVQLWFDEYVLLCQVAKDEADLRNPLDRSWLQGLAFLLVQR